MRGPTRLTLATALALCTLALGAVSATAAGPTVATTGGSLEGLTGPSGDEWRGIPYAAPPIGSLRWKPPAPANTVAGAARRHGLRRAVHPARGSRMARSDPRTAST